MSPSPACASSTAVACAASMPQEIAQIAGRAGRFRKDGAFGVTGDAPDLDPDVVGAVEGHVFPSVMAAEWRNARLDFQSLPALMRSLAAPPPAPELRLSEESQDETTLRQLSTDELIIRRTRDRANLMRLWEVCQTPDFRKTTQDEHARLIADDVRALDPGRPAAAGRLDAMASSPVSTGSTATSTPYRTRLARVRTLAYVANRADWLADPQDWQGRAREARGPALRHAARAADAAVHRPADQRAHARLERARRADPRRHRRTTAR